MNDTSIRFAQVSAEVDAGDEQALRFLAAAALARAHGPAQPDAICLTSLLDQMPHCLYAKDRDGRFMFVNAATIAYHGQTDAAAMLGRTTFDFHALNTAQVITEAEQAMMASGEPMLDIEEQRTETEKPTWRLTSKLPLRDASGDIIGLIGLSRDITARKRAETLRSGQANLLEMIARNEPLCDILAALVLLVEAQLDGISGSILLLDADGARLRPGAAPNIPSAFSALIDGLPIGPEIGSCGSAAWEGRPVIVSDTRNDRHWVNYQSLVDEFRFRSCWSTPILTPQGAVLGTFALYSYEVREPTAEEMQLVAMATHIAGIAIERQQTQDRIHFMAHHDALTGLPNRAFFKEKITQVFHQAKLAQQRVTVAYVDLDNFKQINDSLGHSGGDELLRQLATRMLEFTRASDLVVRLGGDEFVLVFGNQQRGDAPILGRLRELRNAISQPYLIDGAEALATCSMGVATFPDDGETPETVIAAADAAMYRAKQLGRDTLYVCGENEIRAPRPPSLQDELRIAIRDEQLFLDYQPQIDVVTGKILGIEALVRWKHPSLGLLSPAQFIPMAEQCGLVVPLGLWVLRTACRQNKAWQAMGLAPVIVAVNVSAKQFCDPSLPAQVAEALADSGLEPRYLELELTENSVMRDVPGALAAMRAIEALGVRLSIDDFGTGYSNLLALRTFPVQRLKIDRSFIESLPDDETTMAIASAVIALGRELKLSVVAEGVETDAQMNYLRRSGCGEAQGFHFSRPVDPQRIEALLRVSC